MMLMLPEIREHVSLTDHSTMRLGGHARYLAEARTMASIKSLADWAKSRNLPIIVIGQGSNIVWSDEDFNGLIIVNRIPGRKIIKDRKSTRLNSSHRN